MTGVIILGANVPWRQDIFPSLDINMQSCILKKSSLQNLIFI
jgi:hypothetical protein